MLAYPATLLVTLPTGEQRAFTDPQEAELYMEGSMDKTDNPQVAQRVHTPARTPQLNRSLLYTKGAKTKEPLN